MLFSFVIEIACKIHNLSIRFYLYNVSEFRADIPNFPVCFYCNDCWNTDMFLFCVEVCVHRRLGQSGWLSCAPAHESIVPQDLTTCKQQAPEHSSFIQLNSI